MAAMAVGACGYQTPARCVGGAVQLAAARVLGANASGRAAYERALVFADAAFAAGHRLTYRLQIQNCRLGMRVAIVFEAESQVAADGQHGRVGGANLANETFQALVAADSGQTAHQL